MVAVFQFSNFFLFEKAEKEKSTFTEFANIVYLQNDNYRKRRENPF